MGREILFRGKDVHTKEWRYGSLLDFAGDGTYFLIVEPYISASTLPLYALMKDHAHFVVPQTVGQYTGLKDRNGNSIFEGDIVDHYYQKEFRNRGVVMWDSQNARFAHELRTMSPAFVFFHPEPWEVVGNIHDNPELIERK